MVAVGRDKRERRGEVIEREAGRQRERERERVGESANNLPVS